MANILVCDDDREIADAIEIYLRSEGHKVIKAYNGQEALDKMEGEEIHLVVMDIMMPVLNGIEATLKLREKSHVPVILLSAKSEDNDKILGLNIGADDYVTKPFNQLELVARVKSQLRRYTELGAAPEEKDDKDEIIVNGGLIINDSTKEVVCDGREIRLTPIEYNIIKFLAENAGRIFSTSRLYEAVWNEEAIGSDNVIAVHIRHIREKLEIDPKSPRYLKVVWGQGYKIEKME